MKSSTATARVKELVDEGYVWEPPERKRGRSGVMSRTLMITERKAGASPLDRVRVEVELTIDCNGNYGARASVIDAPPTAPHSAVILRKRYTLTAPHPDTYTRPSEAPSDRVSVLRMGEKRSGIEDVIDGDYQVIT